VPIVRETWPIARNGLSNTDSLAPPHAFSASTTRCSSSARSLLTRGCMAQVWLKVNVVPIRKARRGGDGERLSSAPRSRPGAVPTGRAWPSPIIPATWIGAPYQSEAPSRGFSRAFAGDGPVPECRW
jgi:hypothetical protein